MNMDVICRILRLKQKSHLIIPESVVQFGIILVAKPIDRQLCRSFLEHQWLDVDGSQLGRTGNVPDSDVEGIILVIGFLDEREVISKTSKEVEKAGSTQDLKWASGVLACKIGVSTPSYIHLG